MGNPQGFLYPADTLSINILAHTSDDELIAWARKHHHNEEDFYEGDIEDRMSAHAKWVLVDFDLSLLHPNEWEFWQPEVDDFVQQVKDGSPLPAIIVDTHDANSIVDGMHRVRAALDLGCTTIRAWIPAPE